MKPATAPAPTRTSDPLEVLAFCLSAPAPPAERDPDALRAALTDALKRAANNLRLVPDDPPAPERLQSLVRGELTADAIRDAYATDSELARDVYLARAFAERPEQALALLEKRRYLEAAETPAADAELLLDRTIADEQLTPAALVTQPDRLPAIEAAFAHFRREYTRHYLDHHRRYWAAAAALHDHLLQAGRRSRALALLNTLTELAPPVGEATIERLGALLAATDECAFAGDLPGELAQRTTCPACEIKLTDSPPGGDVDNALSRLDRSIERQMERLASAAVHRALANSGDPRIDRFLKVVQAAQLASLVAVLDDELVGYLRRFLLESRIQGLLEPILDRVQRGTLPDEPEVREPLDELARALERALRASRALPEPASPPRPAKARKRA